LFSVKPAEYLANDAFRWKLALLVCALVNVAFQHRRGHANAWRLTTDTRIAAALSLCFWLSALVAGRWIGFL
jgi:hypothetical protein